MIMYTLLSKLQAGDNRLATLYAALAKKWKVGNSSIGESNSRRPHTSYNVDVSTVAEVTNQIFIFLSLLALPKAEGFNQLVLGVILKA